MNATDHTEEALETPLIQGPGKQLRDVRVAKEMDINRVATLLHLNVTMLEALEADDFSQLPSAVFVQGYLRNYARLLDVPVAPILDAFHQYRPVEEESTHLKPAQIRREVRSSHTLVRLITWLIVIAIVALVVTWWRGYLQWPLGLGVENGEPTVEPSAANSPDEAEGAPVAEDGTVTLPALFDKPEILDAPATEPAESAATLADDAPSAAQLAAGQSPVEPAAVEPEPIENPPLSSPAEPAPASSLATAEPLQAETLVSVSFTDACWTDIRDASGSFRVVGNKTAGDRLVLAGEAPYKMVFGNASAVTVLVDGVPYDLAPHIRGNVAKFTLRTE